MCKISVLTSLFNCLDFLEGYFDAVKNINNQDDIEILLLHNSPKQEELIIINQYLPVLPFVKHIIIPEREGLYSTWNRGVNLAKGKYVTIWNVDDVRLPNSLSEQAYALDSNQDAALSYGNFVIVNKYGSREGVDKVELEYESNPKSFLRVHHIGCFPMWRKDIHDTVGLFDEQFKLVADLDFQIRVSQKYPLVKVNTKLGYYLENTPTNLSSNRKLQRTERTALNVRYGNFDLLHLPYLLSSLRKIKVTQYKWNGVYHQKREWAESNFMDSVKKFPLIAISLFNLPLDTLRYIKYALPRSYQEKLG